MTRWIFTSVRLCPLLLILLCSFSWESRWSSRFYRIVCIFSEIPSSKFLIPYYRPFCSQSILWLYNSALFWPRWDKSFQVSRTLLSILADLNNAIVWMVSTRDFLSKSSSPCTNPLVTVPRLPITIDITVTFMFRSFSLPKQYPSSYPPIHFLSILSSLFLWTIIRSGCLAEIRWSVCISKSQGSIIIIIIILQVSFSQQC